MSKPILTDEFTCDARAKELTDLGVERAIVGFEHIIDPDFATRSALSPKAYFDWAVRSVPDLTPCHVLLDVESHDSNLTPAWVESVDQCVRAVHTIRPMAKVSAYGYPWLDPWPGGLQWCDQGDDAARSAALDKSSARYGPLMRSFQWASTCAYDTGAERDYAALHYRLERLRLARRLVSGETIAALCLYRAPNSANDPNEHEIWPIERVIERQVVPAQLAGADGFLIWQQERWKTEVAVMHQPSALQAQLRGHYERGLNLASKVWDGDKAKLLAQLREMIHERTVAAVRAIRRLAA